MNELTYEAMPDFTDEISGMARLSMTGQEIGIEYFPDVVYDQKDGLELHLQIIQPKVFAEPDRDFPAVIFVQGSAWRKQPIYRNVGNLSLLAKKGYFVAIVEYRPSSLATFPSQVIRLPAKLKS